MNKGIAMAAAFVPAAVLLLAGCASETARKPATEPVVIVPAAKVAPKPPADAFLEEAAARSSAPFEGSGWKSLFDGRDLAGWRVTDFAGHEKVECESGLLVIEAGDMLSGVNWTNNAPKMNYEVALDAMRVEGSDFFCGLTFPVGNTNCTLILGGWGGSVTGLSSIDGEDASENETSRNMKYERGRWYRVRVRVTESKIEAWVDAEQIVDLKTKGRQIGLRYGDIELSRPLGVATYETRAAIREIKIRQLGNAPGQVH
jgi:Domain of Unknown Function (DUF1080)